MLVLSRRTEEALVLGDDIVVRVLSVRAGNVRLGIEAPAEIIILRSELLARECADGKAEAEPLS